MHEPKWTDEGPTDEDLVPRILAGEIALFEVVMRRNNRKVYRAVRAILKNEDEVEEVMQEAYVDAYAHLADYSGRSRLSTWIVRIAVNAAFGRLRRGRRTVSLDDVQTEAFDMITSQRGPDQHASDHELRGILEQAVDGLPDAFRTVFVLRVVEQLTVSETALVLHIPEETVKTRLHRARSLLQAALTGRIGTALPSLFDFHRARCDRVVSGVLSRLSRAPS
jgi:RNA polymerase sigma-70 factor (ECF subfamily)